MAEKMKIGDRVELVGKDVLAKVAYVGTTEFSSGLWIGVILDEPKGKNNGTVQGKAYFSCPENFGLFLRQSQVKLLDEMSASRTSTGSTASSTGRPSLGGSKLKPPVSKVGASRKSLGVDRKISMGRPSTNPPSRTASVLSVAASEKSIDDISPSMSASLTQLEGEITSARVEIQKKDKEIEDLKSEIKDVQEKLDTIMAKRTEDRDKIREFEKTKIQLEQLLEYKAKITESQCELQKLLAQAKKEAQDAIDEKNRHAEEMSEVNESIEMATLDKEMAEEKAEQLQLELEEFKTRSEIAEAELDLLKRELQEKGPASVGADFLNKQQEQQIHKLKEAVVKLRDINANDKIKLTETLKEFEQNKQDLSEVRRLNSKLNQQVDQYEVQIAELHEQIDAALGAEEMVEKLTEKNLTLEEKVREMQEVVDDLEKLQELNDELQDTARETEQDLREEAETANAKLLEAHKKIEAMNYAIADYEQTIQKFRDHTDMLKEKIEDLSKRLVEETQDRSLQTATESIDYKVRFAETKAYARAIEMELRKLEVVQANQHVTYVLAFLPDAFMQRGGDHEAIKMLLLVPRILSKCEILTAQLKEKFSAPEYITRAMVLKTHTVEQYTYGCMMLYLLYTLYSLLQQYTTAFNTCSVELYQKCATLFTEMVVQEKLVDFYIELLRRDQLDENVPLDKLEKAVYYFESLYSVHLSSEQVSGSQFMSDRLEVMGISCSAIQASLKAIKSLTKDNKDELLALLDGSVATTEEIQQVLKKIKRRAPLDKDGSMLLELSTDIQEEVFECCHKLGRVLRVFLGLQKSAIQNTISQGESSDEIPLEKLKELTHEATDKVYGKDDNGPECLRMSLRSVFDTLSSLNDKIQEGVLEKDASTIIKITPPIQICAQSAKERSKDIDQMRVRLDKQHSDIQEQAKMIKMKNEEIREMKLRRDMIEKKVEVACKDVEEQRDRLQRQLDELQIQLKKKEKEFLETTEVMTADMEALAKERRELKDQIKSLQRKGSVGSVPSLPEVRSSPKHAPQITAAAPLTAGFAPSGDGSSDVLRDQIYTLTKALEVEKAQRFTGQVDCIAERANRVRPFDVPRQPGWLLKATNTRNDNMPADQFEIRTRIQDMTNKLHRVKQEYMTTLSENCVAPLGSKPSSKLLAQQADREVRLGKLKEECGRLQDEILHLVAKIRPQFHIKTHLRPFPHPQFTKAQLEGEGLLVGRVTVPSKESKTESFLIDHSSIHRIHQSILA